MEEEMKTSIAYEIAMLVKSNRELREEISKKNDLIEQLRENICSLRYEMEETSGEVAKIGNACDLDVKEGDKIVITWTQHKNSHTVGEVYEVANVGITGPCKDRYGIKHFVVHLKKFDEHGTLITGQGSLLILRSHTTHWAKVDSSTPLSKRVRISGSSRDGKYKFENLMPL